MTTVASLIEYLQTLPPECIVEVLEERVHAWDTSTSFDHLNLDPVLSENCYFLDLREHIREEGCKDGRCFLQLGGK